MLTLFLKAIRQIMFLGLCTNSKPTDKLMIHVLPIGDLEEHEETTTCKCEPNIIKENGELIVVHNSFDGREGVEWANDILAGRVTNKVPKHTKQT